MGFADRARRALKEIRKAEEKTVKELHCPYFDQSGDLAIPFKSDSHYHWWRGGQSVKETVDEVSVWKH